MLDHNNLGTNLKLWFLAGAFAVASSGSVYGASGLENVTDFAQIAKNGFARTVNGAFFTDSVDKSGFPNLVTNPSGSLHNSYAWSMAWFDSQLYVGVVKDILCYLGQSSGSEAGDCSGVPGPEQRAEVWRYTPSALDETGDWGLSGSWQRVFTSPNVNFLISFFAGLPSSFPRDLGYRGMTACDAGDGVQRLYMGTFGIPGNILYHTGGSSGFSATSTSGLHAGLLELSNSTADLGYRSLACFKGRLWTSPAGSFEDVDASLHPVVLMNPRPAQGAAWQTLLDVKEPSSHPLADPDNIGIFQMEAVGNYIYLSVNNRTTGFELWRGNGTDCLPPWQGDGHCNISWTKLIDNGAGRPADGSNPVVDNAGATLGVLGDALYIGAAESGFFDLTVAELLRVPNAGAGDPSWELIVGWPRKDYTLLGPSFHCTQPTDIPILPSALSFLSDPEDTSTDDCLPATNRGPGMASSPYNTGPESYFWRFQEHLGELFIGTLDTSRGGGFNLWRTEDGIQYDQVISDGAGNRNNYGLRTMASIPGLGLALGTANPYTFDVDSEGNPTGGLEIFVGTTAPAVYAAPVAHAGDNFTVFDDVDDQEGTARNGLVMVSLDGEESYDPFGGAGIYSYEWFLGNRVAECAGITDLSLNSDTTDPRFTTTVISSDATRDVIAHTFTLRVTDLDGKVHCDSVTISASFNLPPSADVVASVPFSFSDSDSRRQRPNIKLVDFDGDDTESYDVTGLCTDPDDDIVKCEWYLRDSGNTLSTESTCQDMSDPAGCQIGGTITTLTYDLASQLPDGQSRPDIFLLVEDANGYTEEFRWESFVQPVIDTPDQNDAPVCRSIDLATGKDTALVIHPTNPMEDSNPICIDPDGDELTYTIHNPLAADGKATVNNAVVPAAITYDPDDGFQGVDQFEFLANDGATDSVPVAAAVTVGAPDATRPLVSIGFPSTGAIYFNDGSFESGCGTSAADICGSASDALSSISYVEVAIRSNNGTWWDGNSLVGSETWLVANGAESWSLDFDPPDGSYTIMARAEDQTGNTSTVAEATFTKATDTQAPGVEIDFPVNGDEYPEASFANGCGTPASDICGTASDPETGVESVEVAILGPSGAWWDGTQFNAVNQVWLTATGTENWSLGLPLAAEGEYRLIARSTDRVGQTSPTAEVVFTKPSDEEPPIVGIDFPVAGASYLAGAFAQGCGTAGGDVCGTAVDTWSGVEKVEIAIRDAAGNWWNIGSFTTTENWLPATGTDDWSFDFTPLADGKYLVMARARDHAGNLSNPVEAAFTRISDTQGPQIGVQFPSNGGSYNASTFDDGCGTGTNDVCGTAVDTQTGVATVQIAIRNGGNWWNGSGFVGTETWLIPTGLESWSYGFTPPAAGSYTVTVQATDNAGNSSTSSAVGFSFTVTTTGGSFWDRLRRWLGL